MIDTEKLRSRILSLAMRGELSERSVQDGIASELYAQIIETKSKLVKSGTIRKDKKYEEIDDDNMPYQIPDNWYWVRLGEIINLQSGQDLKPSEYNDHEDGIPYITGASNYGDNGGIIINRWTDYPKAYAYKNDILLSCKGTVGKLTVLQEEKVHIARQIMGIRTYDVDVDFIFYYLQSMIYGIKEAQKGLIPGIERNDVLDLLCPLPPLPEQKRIVKKIETLFHELSKIDALQDQYASNQEALKSKLIDAAIQGKLTRQLPEDGTAEELYEQIKKEKKHIEKVDKLKKTKKIPEITEEEIPFEIPSNWKWVRIGDIFTLRAGKNITAAEIKDESDANYHYLCYGGNGVRGYVTKSNVSGKHVLIGRQGALCGNINMAEGNFYATEHAVVVYQYANTDPDWAGYMLKALNLNQYATSVAQPGLAVGRIEKVLMPLPPVTEQKRIARKVDNALSVINITE